MFVTIQFAEMLKIWFLFVAVSGVNSIEQCGGLSKRSKRIIGGEELQGYMYPWFVAIQENGFTICGGTLISNGLVLSAAHCFNESPDAYTTSLGVHGVCGDGKYQKRYNIHGYYNHEQYSTETSLFDIALVAIKGDTSKFEPVCLPDRILSDKRKGVRGLVIGLGNIKLVRIDRDNRDHRRPTNQCKLRRAIIKLYPEDICVQLVFERLMIPGDEKIKLICAGFLEGKVDTCQGDSGGPLVATDRGKQYFLLGVTSFGSGKGCGRAGTLGVYTDVSHFIEWIKDTIGYEYGKHIGFRKFVAEHLY